MAGTHLTTESSTASRGWCSTIRRLVAEVLEARQDHRSAAGRSGEQPGADGHVGLTQVPLVRYLIGQAAAVGVRVGCRHCVSSSPMQVDSDWELDIAGQRVASDPRGKARAVCWTLPRRCCRLPTDHRRAAWRLARSLHRGACDAGVMERCFGDRYNPGCIKISCVVVHRAVQRSPGLFEECGRGHKGTQARPARQWACRRRGDRLTCC